MEFSAAAKGTHEQSYIHTYIHTFIHAYIHTYIHTHTHTYIHKYITYIHTYQFSKVNGTSRARANESLGRVRVEY